MVRVPIYAASSWTSIVSLTASQFLDPIRDVYEVYLVLGYVYIRLVPKLTCGDLYRRSRSIPSSNSLSTSSAVKEP